MTDKTPPAPPHQAAPAPATGSAPVKADAVPGPADQPPGDDMLDDDAIAGENEVLRAARRAKALEASANARSRPGWKTAAGIGVGVGVGSAALIAALLYAKRKD